MAAYSYSALKLFEQCPAKYYETRILKKYKTEKTEAIIYGEEVHLALELYIKDDLPLGKHAKFKPVADAFIKMKGAKHTELKMAVNKDLEPVEFFAPDVWFRGIADLTIINGNEARIADWKGLPLDTKIPTPYGFISMADLKEGDKVFSLDGSICNVIHKSKIHHKPCIQISFDDKTSITCDEDHRWVLTDGNVVEAKLLKRLDRIPLPKAAQYPPKKLPIDPYVLGLWIADGKRSSSEITKPDPFIWEEIQRRGYIVNMSSGGNNIDKCPTRTVKGIRAQLTNLNLLKNKHIPLIYMQGSVEQRIDLIRGLMDGDGNANKVRKQAVFTTTDLNLSKQVKELLQSLGQRVNLAKVNAFGFNKHVKAYPLAFRPFGLNPFLLPRKASIVDVFDYTWRNTRNYRYITKIELVETIPTQCIGVDSKDQTYLCTDMYIPTHNTGKDKYPDKDQLEIMALMIFAHFPEVNYVRAALVFLLYDNIVPKKGEMYNRIQFHTLWAKWQSKAARIEAASENNVWVMKASALCGWCNVKDCPNYKESWRK